MNFKKLRKHYDKIVLKLKKNYERIAFIVSVVCIANLLLWSDLFRENIPFLEFEDKMKEVQIESSTISLTPTVIQVKGVYKKEGNHTYRVDIPKTDEEIEKIKRILSKDGGTVSIETLSLDDFVMDMILSWGPLLIVLGVFVKIFNGKKMPANKKNSILKSSDVSTTFADVAGCEEEKFEVQELVDYLKAPEKYKKMGAHMPKGILLSGPPGTGKTMLAKAVAGEANVPFTSLSGSDFVEMFVGVGASRVREIFSEAKKNAPSIIFIDEIDAVGRERGAGMGGGNDEREQTLNQILIEMDGMQENNGILVIAATNRPDVLDPALLRSGRFDRRVIVNLPDVKGRTDILKVHAKGKPFEENVNWEKIAKRTPGFCGADLANLINEAAILAVRKNKEIIETSDIDESIDRVMMGPAKKSKKYTEKDKWLVAYHEAGHAVIGLKVKDADMVQKITIIPRGEAGGYNLMTPREEKYFHRKSEFLAKITGLLGGRVAEEIVFGEISAGAVNDIERLTEIAKNMVRVYGMSSLGPIQYANPQGNVFLGRDYTKGSDYSAGVAAEIDKEVRAIVDECYEKCRQILNENRDLLDSIAKLLFDKETLTHEEIVELNKNQKNRE